MSDLLFPCSGDTCLTGEWDHSAQKARRANRDFGCLWGTLLGSGCKGDPETLLQTEWDCAAMVVPSPESVPSLGWRKRPGTLEAMGQTDCQREDVASQGSRLLLYLRQGGVRVMVASPVRGGNQTV